MTTTPFDELAAAIAAERSAWLAVEHRLPGSEGYDPRLWDAWLEAARRCRDACSPPQRDARPDRVNGARSA